MKKIKEMLKKVVSMVIVASLIVGVANMPVYAKVTSISVAKTTDAILQKAYISPAKAANELKKENLKKAIKTDRKKIKNKIISEEIKLKKGQVKKQIKNLEKKIKNLKEKGVKGKELKNLNNKLKKAKKELKKLKNKKELKKLKKQNKDKLNKVKIINKKITTKKNQIKKLNKQINKLKKSDLKSKNKKIKSLKNKLSASKKLLKLYKKLKTLTVLQNKLKKSDEKTLAEVSKKFEKFQNSETAERIENKIKEIYKIGDVKLTDKDKKYIADFKKRLNSDKNDEKKLKELENDVNVFEEYGGAVVEEMHNLAKNNEKNKYGKYLSNLEIGKILLNSYLDREDMNDILNECDGSLVELMEMNDGATSSVSDKARSLASNLLYQAEKNGYVSGN